MAARVVWKAVRRLTFNTKSQVSSSSLWKVRSRVIPALFTTMSIFPSCPAAASIIRPASASSTVSSVLTMAWPPASLMAWAASFAGSGSTSFTTTAAPSPANSSAVARPMPRPAPVTTATLPSSRPTTSSFHRALNRRMDPESAVQSWSNRTGALYPQANQAQHGPGEGVGMTTPSAATAKEPSIRVLVVDDHRTFAEALAIAVGLTRDMTADVATSGPEAVEAAPRLRPDVVLMDLEMPGVDGLAATRQLRGAYPPARIIVVSAHEDDVAKAHAFDAG